MKSRHSDNIRRVIVFFILFAFWVVFSGHFDALHLGLGIICSGLVAILSYDLLLPDPFSSTMLIRVWRFLAYLPWLVGQIVLANLHVVYLVLRPSQIRPRIFRFKSDLRGDLAKVTLANSITLTPGTITMDISENEFIVHAVSDKAAMAVVSGDMEKRVRYVFLEAAQPTRPAGNPTSSGD